MWRLRVVQAWVIAWTSGRGHKRPREKMGGGGCSEHTLDPCFCLAIRVGSPPRPVTRKKAQIGSLHIGICCSVSVFYIHMHIHIQALLRLAHSGSKSPSRVVEILSSCWHYSVSKRKLTESLNFRVEGTFEIICQCFSPLSVQKNHWGAYSTCTCLSPGPRGSDPPGLAGLDICLF